MHFRMIGLIWLLSHPDPLTGTNKLTTRHLNKNMCTWLPSFDNKGESVLLQVKETRTMRQHAEEQRARFL